MKAIGILGLVVSLLVSSNALAQELQRYTESVQDIMAAHSRGEDPNLQDTALFRCSAVHFVRADFMRRNSGYSAAAIQQSDHVSDFFYARLIHWRMQGVRHSDRIGMMIVINSITDKINQHIALYDGYLRDNPVNPLAQPTITQDAEYCISVMRETGEQESRTLF